MQIKKRLRINNWISLIVAVLIATSLFWSFRDIYRTNQNENLVDEIRKTSIERIALRRLLDTAAERFTGKDEKVLFQEARKYYDATFSIFSAILEKYKHKNGRENSPLAFSETDSRLIGQVFLKSYALIDRIAMLHELSKKAELERINKVFVDRELRMLELKERIAKLEENVKREK
ncbi:MAG: hypothetical protein PHV90_09190 [Smithella sp.]|nr:hypothetical protein [Smithella sp.]